MLNEAKRVIADLEHQGPGSARDPNQISLKRCEMVVHRQTPGYLRENNTLHIIGQVMGRNEHTGKERPQNNRKHRAKPE